MNNATKVTDPRKGMIHGTIVSRILSLLSIIYSWLNQRTLYILYNIIADVLSAKLSEENPAIFVSLV